MANTYVTLQGDAWDHISFKIFGSEFYAHHLMEANDPHRYVVLFSGGVELAIPTITPNAETTSHLPPWKRGR
ncbi:tail protein X [Yersinia mollaretii]|uniref:phage tail protein n=1 Tax=Yersinia mollaretii TaxID=33060 RepID=UPI00119D8D38|nr:phage tail protein [Yersinia mollaretii]